MPRRPASTFSLPIPSLAPVALVLLAAATLVAAPAAYAQKGDGAGRAAQIFERFDKDKDGFVSEAEFNEARSQRQRRGGGGGGKANFAEFDGNKDGKLSREEFNTALMDVAERARDAMPTFEDFDLDKNGKIDEGEFTKAKEQMASNKEGGGRRRGAGGGGANFADFDGNRDGAITKEEFQKHLSEVREKMQERRR